MQIGHTTMLIELGLAALTKSGNPKNKAAVSKAFRTLRLDTPVGRIDFRKGPIPGTVVNTPIIGVQWVKPKAGSKFKFEPVVTSNAGDPEVPIQAKLKPYR